MEDFEKNRVEHVQHMEMQVKHMSSELEKFKTIAERWEPRLTVQQGPDKITFGLQFGGKHVHASVTAEYLVGMDSTTATSAVVDALIEGLVVEQIRKVVGPELEKVQKNVKATVGAGKW